MPIHSPIYPRLRAGSARFVLPTLLLPLLWATPAAAHHLMDLFGQRQPTALAGLLSGLGHPLIGPDHLLFLLAIGLVGVRHSGRWALLLLATGLTASGLGLVLPGLPGAELLVALSLVLLGLVLCDCLPRNVLIPAFALHGYVLGAAAVSWQGLPVVTYLLGLLISQGCLLVVALRLIAAWSSQSGASQRRLLAGLMIGAGGAFAWSSLVA